MGKIKDDILKVKLGASRREKKRLKTKPTKYQGKQNYTGEIKKKQKNYVTLFH